MNVCRQALEGANQVSITTTKQDDGRYAASCQTFPDLPKVIANQESTAIEGLKRAIESHVWQGRARS